MTANEIIDSITKMKDMLVSSVVGKSLGSRGLYKFIQSRMDSGVKDITAKFRDKEGFLHIDGELAFFMPTLLELGEEHQMRTDEYPFAFGTICKPDDHYADELVSDSLSLSYLSDNPQKAKRLLNDPSIHKMFVNDQTFTMQVSAPHEGFQADFLYGAKASNYDGKNNILELFYFHHFFSLLFSLHK